MNRRDFIKNAALGVSAAVVIPSLFAGCKEDLSPITTDKRIVIVGAGIAGLRAAHYFRQRGVEVTVLEAQEKAGGRVRTDRSLGLPFDEGASWIHGSGRKNPITDVAAAAGATTFVTDDESVAVFDTDGTQYSEDALGDAERDFNRILNRLNGSSSQSFSEAFYAENSQYENDRLWTYFLSAYLEFDSGGDVDELSSQDYNDDDEYRGEEAFITDGYDKVVDYLQDGITVELNVRVDSIDYSGDEISIVTDNGGYLADYVIVTVPLGVLKQNVIDFTPSLPANKQSAIDGLKMGNVNKYLCIWDSAFWDTDLQYIGYTPEVKGKFNYFLNIRKYNDTNALMAFSFGDYSVQAEQMTDAEVMAEITSHLQTIYGTSVPLPTQMKRTSWNTNVNSYGSYSFVATGARSTAYDELAEQVDNKLFFAGEHTSKDYRGTVHGAYESGEREAKRIAELLEA